MLVGAALEHVEQRIEVGEQDIGCACQLYRKGGVEHVARRHALMHEPRLRSHVLGDVGQEGDDVVLGLALDRVDPLDLERAAFPDRGCGLWGYDAQFGERVGGMRLDLEPDAEARLGRPDRDHFGAGIAGDHGGPSAVADARTGSSAIGQRNPVAIRSVPAPSGSHARARP